MTNSVDEIVHGIKIFFIAPDYLLLPRTYLEEFLNLGYECYFIDNDKSIPMEKKIDALITTFKESIFFFFIDANIDEINWSKMISGFQKKYNDFVRIGILFLKRKNEYEKQALENFYLYEQGIKCGCIQLEYQKKNNFILMEKVLFANQGKGRRKNVRAVCFNDCNFVITTEHQRIQGKLNDISISHFSITLDKNALKVELYEKIPDILLIIKGLYLRTDAVLFMERETSEGLLMIFMFVTKEGKNGLDSRNQKLLLPKLYEVLYENTNNLMKDLFEELKVDETDRQ